MFQRIALVLSAGFWLTMNYLLWRSEFGGHAQLGSVIPTELVWRKILTAPDSSTLDIYHHGTKVGYCRWTASSGLTPSVEQEAEEGAPAGNLQPRTPGYRLALDGGVETNGGAGRIHFDLELKLNGTREWREFNLRVGYHDNVVAVHTLAAEKKLLLRTENGGEKEEHEFTFDELSHPEALAKSLDLPLALGPFGAAESPSKPGGPGLPGLGLEWEARNDWLTIAHAPVRVYRLQAGLIGDRRISVLTSPVGEIFRVELPDDWVLANDQTGGMQGK